MALAPHIETLYSCPSQHLSSCHFAGKTGFVCGSGQLLRTFDGGLTWQSLASPVVGLHGVFCVDAWNVYLNGYQNYFSLWHSTDAGNSWQQVLIDDELARLRLFFVRAGELGIVLDAHHGQRAARMLVHNAGLNTWTEHKLELGAKPESVLFLDSTDGLMLAGVYDPSDLEQEERNTLESEDDESKWVTLAFPQKSKLFATKTGGSDWKEISNLDGWVSGLCFVDGKLFGYGLDGIFMSTDMGIGWARLPVELPEGASSVTSIVAAEGRLVAVGDYGFVAVSNDGGNSWFDLKGFSAGHLIGASLVDSELIVIGNSAIQKVRLANIVASG